MHYVKCRVEANKRELSRAPGFSSGAIFSKLSLAGSAVSIIFVATKVCHDRHVFVATKPVFGRDKSMLAATKLLSGQNYVCRQGYFCRDKRRVLCLS